MLFTALVTGVLAVFAWMAFRAPTLPPEPVYAGQTLSHWLAQFDPEFPNRDKAELAVRAIGTNAIPTLLKMMRAHESPLTTKFFALMSRLPWEKEMTKHTDPKTLNVRAFDGFTALGNAGASAIPELIKIVDDNSSWESENCAVYALGNFGHAAKAGIPALLRASAHTNFSVRINVYHALGNIHAEPATVIPVLIKGLRDTSPMVPNYVLRALEAYHGDAKAAVPTLLELLNDPKVSKPTPGMFIGMGPIVTSPD